MQQAPNFKNRQKEHEWPTALAACHAFRRHDLQYSRAPDDEPHQTGMAPDFVFVDTKSGEDWNVEVKRLVSPHIRQQYAVAVNTLSGQLDGIVPGTYTCEIHIDALDLTARLSLPELDTVVRWVRAAVANGSLPGHCDPIPGYRLSRIGSGGSRVEPWLWDYTLEPGSIRETEALRWLSTELARHLENALRKFRAVPADRNILIFETRGTLFDRDLLALDPRAGGPVALSKWMSFATTPWNRTDTVIVEPHVSIWLDATDRAVLMGTKYSADTPHTPLGTLVRLWPGGCPDFTGLRLGLPNLLELSECSCGDLSS